MRAARQYALELRRSCTPLLLFLFSSSLTASCALAQWQDPVVDTITRTQTKKMTASQSLDLDSSGCAHLAWRTASYNPTDFRIFYSTNSPNGIWSVPEVLSDPTESANSPALTVSSVSCLPYVSFETGTEENSEIHVAYRSEGVWHVERITDNNHFDRFSTITTDLMDHLHLAWITQDTVSQEYKLAYAFGKIGSWQIQTLAGSQNPLLARIAISPQGIAHIVYRGGYPLEYHIHHAWNDSLGGRDWNYEVIMSNNYADIVSSLMIEADGDLHLAVGGHGPDFVTSPRSVYYLHKSVSGDWESPELVASKAYEPCLDVDRKGNPHIVWMQMDELIPILETGNLFHSSRNEHGSWQASLAIGNDYFNASFRLDEHGFGHVGCNTGGNTRIYDVYHVRSGRTITRMDEDLSRESELTSFWPLCSQPNPCVTFTRIAYATPEWCRVKLTVHNILGDQVETLVDTGQPAGLHNVIWYATDKMGRRVPSGQYILRLVLRSAGTCEPVGEPSLPETLWATVGKWDRTATRKVCVLR